MERASAGDGKILNSPAKALASGKDHKKENFPVASALVKPEHRAPIMAFYRFARAADDVADHPGASPADKLAGLAAMRSALSGQGDEPTALALARTMAERGLDPVHAHDLLDAFEQDVTVDRYADWDSLIAYCRKSAMPVGRYVLDVHGEDRSLWPASDALCAALQIINHLQDCGKDYHAIGRVYVPADSLAATGARIEDLGAARSSPALRATIAALAERTQGLLRTSAPFAFAIRDRRLGAEVAIIQRLAEDLANKLRIRDPLSERVHHGKFQMAALALSAVIGRFLNKAPA